MLTIALTGGIGSGKTAVTDLFQSFSRQQDSALKCSLEIIDADTITRNLLAGSLQNPLQNKPHQPSALHEVYHLFGSELFDSEGFLDRNKLRLLIFSAKKKKQQLESLLHPLVYSEIFSQLSSSNPDIAIIAIPLLFETKAEKKFDRILVIDIPTRLQIERSTHRDNCSSELIKKIISSQVDRQTRLNQADDIIDNSGSFLELESKVKALFQYYCAFVNKE